MWSIDSCVSYRLYVRVMLVFIKEMYRRVPGYVVHDLSWFTINICIHGPVTFL